MIRSRRAISLVELLVVMTFSTVAISLAGSLVCRVMQIQVNSRTHASVERNSLRLAEQFRRDVHEAETAATSKDGLQGDALLELRFADGREARYSRQERFILRQVLGGDGPAAREEFEFPVTCDAKVEQQGAPPQLTLTITTGPLESQSNEIGRPLPVPVSLQVTSTLGSDVRLGRAAAEQEASE